MNKLIYFIFTSLIWTNVQSANILGVPILPVFSHHTIYQPIWRELSLKGHQVTVLTSYPIRDPALVNLTEIDLSFTRSLVEKGKAQKFMNKNYAPTDVTKGVYEMYGQVVEAQLSDSSVQSLITDHTKTFDVVMVEFYHPGFYALSARFRCPLIGITSVDALIPGHDAVGNPSHPVLHPDVLLPFSETTGFYQRLYSTYYSVWFRIYHNYYMLPKLDKLARKYITEDMPYLGDIEKNVSMLFLNANPFLNVIRPNMPTVIPMGGVHIKKKNLWNLSKDLQKELDSAKQGVVYLSLGSNVRSANLPQELIEKIISAVSQLPYKVFWKWEEDRLPGKPQNVVIRKWFPQQDVLGHKNVKVFLTQGGLQSMEEAIYNGVPLVGMPFFSDQPTNVKKMINLGIAIGVDPDTVTKDELKSVLIEVAENPEYYTDPFLITNQWFNCRYRSKIKELSEIISDVPMTGLEKAVWWTEYVIRHRGAKHLRSPAVDMPLYEYFLLDVLAFVIVVTVVSLFVVHRIVKSISKLLKLLLQGNKVKLA